MATISINDQVAIQNHIAARGVTVCPTMFAAGYSGQASINFPTDIYKPEAKNTDDQTLADLFFSGTIH